MRLRRGLVAAIVTTLPLAGTTLALSSPSTASPSTASPSTSSTPSTAPTAAAGETYFSRSATFPVFANRPAGEDPATATVAEISDVSPDGRTLVYTDALAKRIGFLDITDPSAPAGLGTLSLAQLGDTADEPTSVAIVGEYVLVVVDTSTSFTDPSGRLDVVRLADRTRVRSIPLGGQPDSISISPDQGYAAIAMENQRDENVTPSGSTLKGDLPQLPAGFLQTLRLTGDPSSWTAQPVPFTNTDGTALASFTAAGIYGATDPEPEYVDVNADNQVVVTLQENNGVVVVDLPTRTISTVFSAGSPTISGVDTTSDGVFNPTATIAVPREPDAVQWVGPHLVATANEGDLKGGSRGWTVFDTATGLLVWDAGNTFEQLATRHGLFNDGRAKNKGSEPEGLAFATFDGTPYAFVGSERSNFVAVYDMSTPTSPVFRQVLPATNGPEGLLPIPGRDLLAVSSETDNAAVNVRASVSLFSFDAEKPFFPTVVSDDEPGVTPSRPIGWGALGALAADPTDPQRLWTASDSASRPGRIYSLDVGATPARITSVLTTTGTDGTTPANLDVEGLVARPDGGFWLASEGATGAANQLVRTDATGRTLETVPLPAEIAAKVKNWGFEGVTLLPGAEHETLVVALQRTLWNDASLPADQLTPFEGNVSRIGRYDTVTQTWSWYAYPLESTTTAGDWIGVSEVTAVDADTVAVIERDKLNGPAAKVKRVYTVDLPGAGAATGEAPTPLTKELSVDVLPLLRSTHGWTQEKLEGLTVAADGQVYAVTDNDGLKDATGETQLLRLGTAFEDPPAPTTTSVDVAPPTAGYGVRRTVTVEVAGVEDGEVTLTVGGLVRTLTLADGVATTRLPATLARGRYDVVAEYAGDDTHAASSAVAVLRVDRAFARVTETFPARTDGRARGTVGVRIEGSGLAPTGRVEVRDGRRVVGAGRLDDGKVRLVLDRLPRGKQRLTIVYLGSDDVRRATRALTIRQR